MMFNLISSCYVEKVLIDKPDWGTRQEDMVRIQVGADGGLDQGSR